MEETRNFFIFFNVSCSYVPDKARTKQIAFIATASSTSSEMLMSKG